MAVAGRWATVVAVRTVPPMRPPRTRRGHRGRSITLTLGLAVAIATGAACTADAGTGDLPGVGRVVEVIDGDTIVVDLAGEERTVRLLGIDTPETHHPSKPIECHGPEASARLAELLPEGSTVQLTRDVELYDVYGRVLAYVTRLPDGLDVNLTMAAEGHADALRIPPNTASAATTSQAVANARSGRQGLWGHCADGHTPATAADGP